MQRLLSTLSLFAFLCSSIAASGGGQLLCSHFDGKGHVVEIAVHDREALAVDCSDLHEASSEAPLTHRHGSGDRQTPLCDDEEVPNPEWGSQFSGKDRLVLKTFIASQIGFDCGAWQFATQESRPRSVFSQEPLALENASNRRFAKFVRIRC